MAVVVLAVVVGFAETVHSWEELTGATLTGSPPKIHLLKNLSASRFSTWFAGASVVLPMLNVLICSS